MEQPLQPTEQAQNVPVKKAWYKKWWGVIIALCIWPFFAIWYIWKNTQWSKSAKWVATVVVVLLFLLVQSALNDSKEKAQRNALQETPEEAPLSYEIVKDIGGGTAVNLQIYTIEKDDNRIIQITDKIISENPRATHIFIDYYDDKKVASEYNHKIFDEKVSETEKDELFTHYLFNLKYNTTTGHKVLAKQVNKDWVELKKY
jgi:hypothetical protein